MEKKKKEKRPDGLNDPDRAAYMIAWRDRHIEKQKEIIAGYEEQLSLAQALLAFALLQKADEQDGARVVCIPKEELSALLSQYVSEVESEEDAFILRFLPVQEPQDGGEQNAG